MAKLKLKTKPFPYQLKATKRAVKEGSHAFFFDPRCGKTKAALDAIAIQRMRGVIERVVVIAPISALSVWEDQIEQHFSLPAAVKVVGESLYTTTTKAEVKEKGVRFYLINYDKFSRRGDYEVYRNDYLRALERWRPDLVVLDESHRCKSAGALRSQALWRMVRRARVRESLGGRPYVYLLTGTPNPKGWIDLFAQYRILDESIFGTSKATYEDRYCVYGLGSRKYTIVKYRHVKGIKTKVNARASVVPSAKAGLEGKTFFNPIRVELPYKVKRAYKGMVDDFLAEIEGQIMDAPNAGVRRLRLLQITGGFTTDGVPLHDVKLKAAKDYLVDLREQGESVVVYARFLNEVSALTDACENVGFATDTITGKVNRRSRSKYIRDFQQPTRQRDRKPRALVFQVDTGSLSIELSAAAEVFYYSLPDGWETFWQSLQRVGGPNQKRPVRYSFLVAKDTVDVSVLAALRNKRNMHAEMMQSPASFLMGL